MGDSFEEMSHGFSGRPNETFSMEFIMTAAFLGPHNPFTVSPGLIRSVLQ
jgi:hypothetical protein